MDQRDNIATLPSRSSMGAARATMDRHQAKSVRLGAHRTPAPHGPRARSSHDAPHRITCLQHRCIRAEQRKHTIVIELKWKVKVKVDMKRLCTEILRGAFCVELLDLDRTINVRRSLFTSAAARRAFHPRGTPCLSAFASHSALGTLRGAEVLTSSHSWYLRIARDNAGWCCARRAGACRACTGHPPR